MSGKQQTVLVLGITLIILRMWATGQWKILWGLVSNPDFGPGYLGKVGSIIGKTAPLIHVPSGPAGGGQGAAGGNKSAESVSVGV